MGNYFSTEQIEIIKMILIFSLGIGYFISILMFFRLNIIFKDYRKSTSESINFYKLINSTQEEIIEILKRKVELGKDTEDNLKSSQDLLERTLKTNNDLVKFNEKLMEKISNLENKSDSSNSDLGEMVNDINHKKD